MSIPELCRRAKIAYSTYFRASTSGKRPRSRTLKRWQDALNARTTTRPRPDEPVLILSTFRGWAAHFAGKLGVDPATALASDPGLRANSDPAWRKAAQVRELAAYCTVTELDLGAARVARAIGVTRAAVSLMLRRVEDQRDDPTVEEMVEAAARLISGRRE